jgi:hypothetical protein
MRLPRPRAPESIIGWSAIASKGDPRGLHAGGNASVSLVICIDRQGGTKRANFGGMLSWENSMPRQKSTRCEASQSTTTKLRELLCKKLDQKEVTTMAQDNKHVRTLIGARDRQVTHRRDIAKTLIEKHDRGDTENLREAFIKVQDVIEAIERAIWHEGYIAGPKSEPFSPFGFKS